MESNITIRVTTNAGEVAAELGRVAAAARVAALTAAWNRLRDRGAARFGAALNGRPTRAEKKRWRRRVSRARHSPNYCRRVKGAEILMLRMCGDGSRETRIAPPWES